MSSTIELQQPPAAAVNNPVKRNSVISLSTESATDVTSETQPPHVSKHSGTTTVTTHNQIRRIGQVLKALFKQYWFLLGLGIVIGLAWAFPQVGKTDGAIDAQYTVKWGAVIVIFLLSGLGLEVKVMLRTIVRWRLHLTVQLINFAFLPLTMWGVAHFLIAVGARIDTTVYQGWMIAVSTSTTVSSNAVMTRNANGNDSGGERALIKRKKKDNFDSLPSRAALVNAALGNVLGIFISPALMSGKLIDTFWERSWKEEESR